MSVLKALHNGNAVCKSISQRPLEPGAGTRFHRFLSELAALYRMTNSQSSLYGNKSLTISIFLSASPLVITLLFSMIDWVVVIKGETEDRKTRVMPSKHDDPWNPKPKQQLALPRVVNPVPAATVQAQARAQVQVRTADMVRRLTRYLSEARSDDTRSSFTLLPSLPPNQSLFLALLAFSFTGRD
jgi:hypothetical protein